MALARISITVAKALVAAADRRARALGRSRSWVIAQALRESLAVATASPPAERPPLGRVAEAGAPPYAAREVAEARHRRLVSELALPPRERLRQAEELASLAEAARPSGRRLQVLGFDSYEDYYEWKKTRRIGA
jgi:hypothetical protein